MSEHERIRTRSAHALSQVVLGMAAVTAFACGGATAEAPSSGDGTVLHRLPADAPAPAEEASAPAAAQAPEPPPRQLGPAPDAREEVVGRGASRLRVEVSPPPGASWATPGCTASAEEACNGVDDDCDGRVDDGCGYSSGDIQVTLAWQAQTDLDLTVANPNGDVISWRVEQGYDGGQMDHRTEGCDGSRLGSALPGSRTASARRVENVFFTVPSHSRSSSIARGRYTVVVRAADMCTESHAPATVAIVVRGKVVGTVQLDFQRWDESFQIPFTLTDPS